LIEIILKFKRLHVGTTKNTPLFIVHKIFLQTLVLIFVALGGFSFGQNENAKWYYGWKHGIDFMTNPPSVILNSAMLAPEGSASIADSTGNLLFYTDGDTIWDKTHQIMSNGIAIGGYSEAAQPAIIIRQPGTINIYYVFTPHFNGSKYTIVDMSMANGNGSVTAKAISLNYSAKEHVSATRHCNGTDYWITMHNGSNTNGNIAAFPFTASGVGTPVTSTTGFLGYIGSMKFSPSGSKFVIASGGLRIFDFDNSTGSLSAPVLLASGNWYGCEFSPSSTVLYSSKHLDTLLYQFDLCAGSPTAIIASQTTLQLSGISGALQLAPNGKIYVAKYHNNQVGVINFPDITGTGCNYTSTSQFVSQEGLPNLVTYSKPPQPNPGPFTYLLQTNNCQKVAGFSAPVLPCSQVGYKITGVRWDFGDPGSGPANSTTLGTPNHTYSLPGTYTVQLVIDYSCGGSSDTLIQPITVTGPTVGITTHTITCANLGSATVTAAGGVGPYSFTWMPTNQSSSVATNLVPGNYSISLLDAGTNCLLNYTTHLPPLVPFTGMISNSDSLLCYGASNATASIANLAGGSGIQSFLWTNGITNLNTASVSTLYAGQWSVTVTDALTACQINSVFTITQPPALTLNIVPNTNTVCLGGTISFSANAIGGTPGFAFQWTNGPASSIHSVSEVSGGNHIYTLSALDANTCSVTNTISVDFITNPILSLSNSSICPLQTGTLTVSGANNYTWNTGSNNTSISHSPLVTTIYTVTGEALTCISTATASIIVKPPPNIFVSNNSPRCENGSLQLNVLGGASYVWTGPSGFNSVLQSPGLNLIGLNHAGIYNVTVTAVNSCTAAASTTVVVNPTPALSATGATVCTIQQAILQALSFPGSTYHWSGPLAYNSGQQNAVLNNPSLTAAGLYTVKATSAVGCTNTATANLFVVNPPAPTPLLSSNSLCAQALNGSPNSITLTASGADTYTLNTPDFIANLPDPGVSSNTLTSMPPFKPLQTVATATLYGSNGVCTVSTTLHFSVIPNPTISVTSPTPIICAGENFTYTSHGAGSYTWNATTPNYTTYNNGGIAVAHPSINSVFSVFGGSLGCNSASKTSTITVYPIPTVFVDPFASKICLGTTTLLTASGTATDFHWQPLIGLSNTQGNSVYVKPLNNQTYTVTGSANNCTNAAVATIEVLPLPKPVAKVSKALICANETVTLTGSGGENYYWNGPDQKTYDGQAISFEAAFAQAGDYTLTVTDLNKCVNQTIIAVKIEQLPQGSLVGSLMEACVPFCSDLEFSHPAGGEWIEPSWSLRKLQQPASVLKTFEGRSFSHCFSKAGDHVIIGKFTDTKTSCVNTQTFIVHGLEVPEADFKWLPENPVEGLEDVLFLNNSSGENQNKFSWFFINNEGYTSENENTAYFFSKAGEYPVAYIVKTENGCADTALKYITISPDFDFYMPNTFTPNGDDRNDVFIPVVRGLKNYQFLVFDRWGETIFSTSDYLQGWDGTYHGESCKQDAYAWKVTLSTVHGEGKVYAGSVMLMR
jgi:gliding motility-associated-like protein